MGSELTETSLLRKTLVTMAAMVGSVLLLLGTLSLVVLLAVGTGGDSNATSATSSIDSPAMTSTGTPSKAPGGPTKIKGPAQKASPAPPQPGHEI